MQNLFVSFEMPAPQREPRTIEGVVRSLGVATCVLRCLWHLRTERTMEEVRDLVGAALEAGDRLLVVEALNACSKNLDSGAWLAVINGWYA